MAKFESKGLVSVRASQLVAGEAYTMGFSKKEADQRLVTFNGFRNGAGEQVANPKVLKAMPQDWTMSFTGTDAEGKSEDIVVTKDPDGYGAMFIGKRRVTFGADPDLVAKLKAAKEAALAEAKSKKAAEAAVSEPSPAEVLGEEDAAANTDEEVEEAASV